MELSQRQADLARARQIDDFCNRFEAQWRAGKRLRLEDVLALASGPLRAELLRALLPVELELLAREGKQPAEAAYRARFLPDAELVGEVFAELAARRAEVASRDTSVSGSSLHDADRGDVAATGPYVGSKGSAAPATSPQKIGRFEVLEVLGQGGFGKVYRARDPKLDREVAVKVPLPGVLDSERDLERFLREAKSAATIQHPNICPVFEVGQDGDTHYIVMAYVPGQSLAAILKSRKAPMPPRQVALVVRKLALALEAAHAKGIVHRDLKPGNILYDRDRKEMVITDFGLARRVRKDEAQLTQSGVIMGTPAYMAPEQARGDVRAVGPRSDVYSLGVILYEMLCGNRPFAGSVGEVLGQVLHVEPEPPSKRQPNMDAVLESICLKAMAKDAQHRYGSMKAFADVLNDYLKGTAAAEPKSIAAPALTSAAGTGTRQVAELVKELSKEHREETAAAVAEAVKRARVPHWKWLAGSGVTALLVVAGIFFFIRTGSATIIINVPLPEGISLKDASLAFFLDGKRVPAAELEKPVPLDPGDHELVIRRGDVVLNVVRFSVTTDRRNPVPIDRIKIEEVTPPGDPKKFTNSLGMEFVLVPKGKSWLGGGGGEIGTKEVTIAQDFYLGKYEVTQGEWEAVTGVNPSRFSRNGADQDRVKDVADADLKRLPVENMSWDEAQAFIDRLNKQAKDTGWVYRLPTAVEWEYACRGGPMKDKFESAFDYYVDKPTNKLLLDQANFGHGKGLNRTCKVGSYKPNPLGLYDMHGNVYEMCDNTEKAVDPVAHRVHLSGCWAHGADKCRAAMTESIRAPTHRSFALGLRVARVPAVSAGDPDRRAAEWVLKMGHLVTLLVNDKYVNVGAVGDLPQEPFRVATVWVESNKRVDDAGLENLKGCTSLGELQVSGTSVTGRGFAHLEGLTGLGILRANRLPINDRDLIHLKGMTRLGALELAGTRVTDRGMEHLKGLQELNWLQLDGTAVGDAGLEQLKGLTKLRLLLLIGTRVTDKGLEHLRGLPGLKNLNLSATKITIAGLERLTGLTKLRKLLLSDTEVSDAAVPHLVKLKGLLNLELVRTRVSAAGLLELRKALPKCQIVP